MNKFYAIFASTVMISVSAIAKIPEDDSSVRAVRVASQQGSFMEGLQAATTFAGAGAMHSGDSPMTEEKFDRKKAAALGTVSEEKEDKPTVVFASKNAKELHADMVWALGQVESKLGTLSFVNAEASMLSSAATVLKQTLEGTFEESAGNLVTAGTVAAAMYMAERATTADLAGGITTASRYMISTEKLENPALKKAAAKFTVRIGKIIEEKAKRAGRVVLSWIIGTEVVDDSTALGRAYLKVRSLVTDRVQVATKVVKGWATKAAAFAGNGYTAAKNFFGFGKKVTA